MLFQYVYHKFIRIVSVLAKCAMASFYMWVMLHAAAIMPCIKERREKNGYWTYRKRFYLSYSSAFLANSKLEVIIYLLVFWMMIYLYRRCRCNFLGSRCISQTRNIQHSKSGSFMTMHVSFVIYLLIWYTSWYHIIDTYPVVFHFAKRSGSYWLYYQFIIAVMFKIIVLANFLFSHLRIMVILQRFQKQDEQNELLMNDHDFGDHLNVLFFA
ncbi:hypothetical protein KR074_009554 [Drosophila pseudoananassae]|nr:hypothetical protein KR074_009554 [Drosophila pseudoananassae]